MAAREQGGGGKEDDEVSTPFDSFVSAPFALQRD
jgi:hypothetical protein